MAVESVAQSPSTRRGFFSVAATAAAVPVLAACAGSGAGGGQPASSIGKTPVKLRWSPWDGEGQAIVEGANKGVDLYRKTHQNVTVEFVPQDDFGTKINTMIAAGDGPDVFGGNGAVWRDRATQGQFLGLDPLIKRDWKANQVNDYVESHYKAFQLKETGQFSLPMYLGVMAWFYNKGLFKEKGVALPDENWDWAKWSDALKRLTVRPDKFGASMLKISRSHALSFILQNGGNLIDPKDDTVCVIDSPQSLEALQWLNDLYWKDHSAIQNGEVQGRSVFQLFGSGAIASFPEGSWQVTPMITQVGTSVDWDVVANPKRVKRATRGTTDGWGIWKGSKNADEAWEFMKWLQGDDWYEIMMGVVGLTPARLSQQDKWLQLINKQYPQLAGKNLKAFTDGVKQKYAEPEQFFRYHKEAADILDPAFNDSVRDNKVNVTTAMKEATQRVNAVQKQKAGK